MNFRQSVDFLEDKNKELIKEIISIRPHARYIDDTKYTKERQGVLYTFTDYTFDSFLQKTKDAIIGIVGMNSYCENDKFCFSCNYIYIEPTPDKSDPLGLAGVVGAVIYFRDEE